MFRILITLVMLLTLSIPVLAQDDEPMPPDYSVRLPGYEVSEDQRQITVIFSVYNQGGPADRTATARLIDLSNGDEIGTTTIEPLDRGQIAADVGISFSVTRFPPDSNQAIQIEVGVGEIEPEDSPTISNNRAGISVPIPNYDPALFQGDDPLPDEAGETDEIVPGIPRVFVIPGLNLEFDTSDRDQMLIAAGIGASFLLMLLIVILILRLLFRRPPTFGNWQPPYATMPPLDPNSTYGRRQLWQQHAQNNVVPAPCKRGSIHARKVLLGMDGAYLSGWRIMAIRMTQYDMYGRVSRSQILAPGGAVRRMDRTARKAAGLDSEKLRRRVRPVARTLANRFKKKVNKRSAMLPIALDVRLQGTHGEVRILFELHECDNGQPQKIDYWEPEMTVLGKTIHESYTFTIHGQSGGETLREFRRRLKDDIERVLVDLLRAPGIAGAAESAPVSQPGPSAESLTNTQPVERVQAGVIEDEAGETANNRAVDGF